MFLLVVNHPFFLKILVENTLHSLHTCCNRLILNVSKCNENRKYIAHMSLILRKSAMNAMGKQVTLHSDALIHSEL